MVMGPSHEINTKKYNLNSQEKISSRNFVWIIIIWLETNAKFKLDKPFDL